MLRIFRYSRGRRFQLHAQRLNSAAATQQLELTSSIRNLGINLEWDQIYALIKDMSEKDVLSMCLNDKTRIPTYKSSPKSTKIHPTCTYTAVLETCIHYKSPLLPALVLQSHNDPDLAARVTGQRLLRACKAIATSTSTQETSEPKVNVALFKEHLNGSLADWIIKFKSEDRIKLIKSLIFGASDDFLEKRVFIAIIDVIKALEKHSRLEHNSTDINAIIAGDIILTAFNTFHDARKAHSAIMLLKDSRVAGR